MTTRTHNRVRSFRWLVVLGTLAAGLALPALSVAQIGVELEKPIHIRGYWDHSVNDPGIIGTITFTSEGKKPRVFGATAVLAYMAGGTGVQVFSAQTAQKVIDIEGRKNMVNKFMSAKPNQLVNVFGMFIGEPSANFILMSVSFEPRPSRTATGEKKKQ